MASACSRRPLVVARLHASRQSAISVEICGKAKKHEDRGDAEAVVPAINLCEQTAEQRSSDRSDVDSRAKDDETAGPSRFVLWRIKSTYLRRNIALQKTRADDEQQQSQEE